MSESSQGRSLTSRLCSRSRSGLPNRRGASRGRGFARHARGRQLADALVDMELELLVELGLDAPGPEDVEET